MDRMKILWPAFAVTTLVVFVSSVAKGAAPGIEDLRWMVGHWAGAAGGVEMEELWIEPKGGVMLGLHRDVTPAKPAFFEFLRIEDREGEVVFVASPLGSGETEFRLMDVGQQHVAFENLEHDFPQRIIYRREGEGLTARIEGVVEGKLESTEWSWFQARWGSQGGEATGGAPRRSESELAQSFHHDLLQDVDIPSFFGEVVLKVDNLALGLPDALFDHVDLGLEHRFHRGEVLSFGLRECFEFGGLADTFPFGIELGELFVCRGGPVVEGANSPLDVAD